MVGRSSGRFLSRPLRGSIRSESFGKSDLIDHFRVVDQGVAVALFPFDDHISVTLVDGNGQVPGPADEGIDVGCAVVVFQFAGVSK